MDSMRSLNTSLPKNMTPDLLAAFRTAALSVTNLYKAAASSDSSSHHAGYQDALEDLLAFLDKENLGLQDGEGWSVRQWATEKYDRDVSTHQANDSDYEPTDMDKERSASPARSSNSADEENGNEASLPPRSASAPAEDTQTSLQIHIDRPSTQESPMYRFTGEPPTPQDTPMQPLDSSPIEQREPSISTLPASESPVRVEVVNRGSRTPHRHAGLRNNVRPPTRDFTFTAGSKRKLQFPDFFDISNLGAQSDGSHGRNGKKGRFT